MAGRCRIPSTLNARIASPTLLPVRAHASLNSPLGVDMGMIFRAELRPLPYMLATAEAMRSIFPGADTEIGLQPE